MFVRYRLWPELTVSTVVRTLFLIFSASFTSVMVTCISWFDCTPDVRMGLSGIPGSVVYVFPAISCRSAAYYGWSCILGGCLGLWLLVIGATAWWLVQHRRQLAILQNRSVVEPDFPANRVVEAWSALALRPEVQSPIPGPPDIAENPEGLGRMADLKTLWMRVVDFGWYWPGPAAGQEWGARVCHSGLDNISMETRREYAFRSIYGPLYDSFRSEAIGWLVVVWIRRMLLILLSVMLTSRPSAKYLAFGLLHLGIFCLQMYYQPFRLNRLNEAEQVGILVHIMIAMVLSAYPSPTEKGIQSVVLTLTLAPLVTYVIYGLGRRYRIKRADRTTKVRAQLLGLGGDDLSAPFLPVGEVEIPETQKPNRRAEVRREARNAPLLGLGGEAAGEVEIHETKEPNGRADSGLAW